MQNVSFESHVLHQQIYDFTVLLRLKLRVAC